jgi:metal-sulfur cluster biosynthetic enzyme
MNTLYVHTTPTERQKGNYKFGQTSRTADGRIKEQARTAMSENPEKVWEGVSTLTDHEIHKKLTKMGFTHIIREWYGGFTSDDEVVAVMNQIIGETLQDTRVEYSPRYFQSQIKNQFLSKYQEELRLGYNKIDFALELAPRFGKTIWAIDLLNTLFLDHNIKICIIPTYVLTAITSFKKEFYTFKGYSSNMVFVTSDDNLQKVINENYGDKLIVVAMSLHMREHELKLDDIKEIPSKEKVSIIDEADFGAHRMNSQGKIDHLNCGLNIYMTGTAIERVALPLSNLRDNLIRWSYTDMLMVKKGEHPIQVGLNDLDESKNSVKDIIIPQFMRLALGGIIDNFNQVPDQYKTDWNKLFADVDKATPILSNLVKSLYGEYNGKLTYLVDLNTSEICPKQVSMIFANTPNKKEQNKFHKLVQNNLGPQYIVELINGDETSNREAEEKAKGVVARAQREGKKVVFISKDMGSRSFSVSEIDTVFLMFDRGSYATISQKVSRVLTPGKTYWGDKKVYGNVISLSLDPNREQVNPIDEYLVYEGEKVQVNELSDGIKRVLRSVNIFINDNGMMEPIISDEYAEKLISSSTLIRVGMETVKVDFIINNLELVKLLTGVEVNNQTEEHRIQGIDSSEVVRTDEEKNKEEKKIHKMIEDIRQKLKQVLSNIVENIVEISEINNCESDNIIRTLDMIYEKGYCEEVVFEVGVDCQTVKDIILSGALSEKLLNTIITSYNKEENSISL